MSRGRNGKTRAARSAVAIAAGVAIALGAATGCRQKMADQPSYRPLEASDFFDDGRASRPLVAGTVPRGGLREDSALYSGKRDGEFVRDLPLPLTRDLVERGRERYDIFCAPCHARTGDGRGMVVRRGFPQAQSFHIDRLRRAEDGYVFDVITKGFGRMQGYAEQVPVTDRWAIVAYVRVLQRSRSATLDDAPPDERARLREEGRR